MGDFARDVARQSVPWKEQQSWEVGLLAYGIIGGVALLIFAFSLSNRTRAAL